MSSEDGTKGREWVMGVVGRDEQRGWMEVSCVGKKPWTEQMGVVGSMGTGRQGERGREGERHGMGV